MVRALTQKMQNLQNRSIRTIGGAALIIAFFGVLSRILGFFRDRMLASTFGAGNELDAYYAAFRIPDLFYGLLVAGALSAAFVPLFTELREEGNEEESWRLTQGLLRSVMLTLSVLSLLGIIFAPFLMNLLVPGFTEEQKVVTATLTRVMLLSPFFLGVSAVVGGVLVSLKRFVAYSLAPVVYNVGIIFGIWFLVPLYGIAGVAIGVVAGSLLHVLVQVPAFLASGFPWDTKKLLSSEGLCFWKDERLRSVLRLMIPRSLSMGITQVSLFVVTIFASTLSTGSLTAFNFANNIQSLPLGVFGVAFSLAAFPVLATFAAQKKHKDFFHSISHTSRRILFFVIPLSVLMIVFRAQFVRIILGSGNFDWEDTIMTFQLLQYFVISLFAQCLIPLFARGFFALKNTKTPLYMALWSEFVHIVSLVILLPHMHEQALALSFSLGTLVNFGLLYMALRNKMAFWDDKDFWVPILKMALAAAVAGYVAQVSKTIFALTTNELDTFIEVFLQLLAGMLIGGGVYLFLATVLRIEELTMLQKLIFKRLLRQPEKIAGAEDHPERGDW